MIGHHGGVTGSLVMVGGAEFTPECDFDADFVTAGSEVVVLPTAHAYENPALSVEAATEHFKAFGASVRALDVFRRPDAQDEANCSVIAQAQIIYVTGGSPMHLRSVLMDTPLLDALGRAWEAGATVAVAAEAATVMCSHMVDSRGGAFTLGLNAVDTMTVIPRFNTWSTDKIHRTLKLAPADLVVVGIPEATALIRSPQGEWSTRGVGSVEVYRHMKRAEFSDLPATLTNAVTPTNVDPNASA